MQATIAAISQSDRSSTAVNTSRAACRCSKHTSDGRHRTSPTPSRSRQASSQQPELRQRTKHPEELPYRTLENPAKNASHADLETVKPVTHRLDLLTTLSMVHRRLDGTHVTP
ncbi:hypothetical protein [Streptomyces sp. NBC_01716]|uniref:hypothetical protein n=1 Tax=Streptomyces sp. NBC_01716 TaxID=2975917 RepID=UPI002E369683|nr:hypothetical protein [Streptomyces sp. NBC_01716]